MATIKAFTDLSQSKKLAEILPLESADMVLLYEEPYETSDSKFDGLHQALCVPFNKYDKSWRQKYKNISYFPCWSLAALLAFLPNSAFLERGSVTELYRITLSIELVPFDWFVEPVDACVDMIEKLKELKML